MAYSSNYTDRTSIFDSGDIIQGDHIKSIYDELGSQPSSLFNSMGVPYAAGAWWAAHSQGATAQVFTANSLYLWPMVIARTTSLDRISSYVTVAGNAGTVIRHGIYNADTNGMPSTLAVSDVTQDGTVTNTSTITGTTISATLNRGRYYLAAVSQGAGTQPTVYPGITSNFTVHASTAPNFTSLFSARSTCFAITGVSGSLSSDLTGSTFVQAAVGIGVAVRMV